MLTSASGAPRVLLRPSSFLLVRRPLVASPRLATLPGHASQISLRSVFWIGRDARRSWLECGPPHPSLVPPEGIVGPVPSLHRRHARGDSQSPQAGSWRHRARGV